MGRKPGHSTIATKSPTNTGAIIKQGIVLPVEHPTDPNLVLVHFGDRTASQNGQLEGGVWCHNMISGFVRYRDIMNNPISYGAYTPIQAYTPVMVLLGDGGAGVNLIIGFAPTNTGTPDIENRNELHVLGQSPKGSYVAIDDKTGNIQLLYEKGNTSLVMGNQAIALEVTKGDKSGKTGDTGIHINKGSIEFRLRDSVMKFDETGLSVSFDDGGSYFKVTKQGAELHGEDFVKLTSKEQMSLKGSKMTLQGTKDASLSAAQLKIGGKQLTNITGAQIDIRSMFTIQLTSLHVGLRAFAMIREVAPIKEGVYPAFETTATTISATAAAANRSVLSPSIAMGASVIAQDGLVLSNMGIGSSVATSATSGTFATAEGMHTAFMVAFSAFLLKVSPITATQKILADILPGTSEPAQDPTGNTNNARNKKDKKTYASVASSKFMANETVMKRYSVVPRLVSKSRTATMIQDVVQQADSSQLSTSGGIEVPDAVQSNPDVGSVVVNQGNTITEQPRELSSRTPKLKRFLKGK